MATLTSSWAGPVSVMLSQNKENHLSSALDPMKSPQPRLVTPCLDVHGCLSAKVHCCGRFSLEPRTIAAHEGSHVKFQARKRRRFVLHGACLAVFIGPCLDANLKHN